MKFFWCKVFIICYFLKNIFLVSPASAQVINLIQNGSFETGTSANWEAAGGVIIDGSRTHTGNSAFQVHGPSQNITLRQYVRNLTPNTTYIMTGWLYVANASGNGGGIVTNVINPSPSGWYDLAAKNEMEKLTPLNTWTKFSLIFQAPATGAVYISIGEIGGDNRQFDATFDDIEVFQKPANNTLPTVTISASPNTLSTIPGTTTFTSSINDIDGSIDYFFWDFGDGGKSNNPNSTHTYVGNGTYPVSLTIYDNEGGKATAQTSITVLDPTYPTITVTNSPPVFPNTTSNPNITISGTATPGSGSNLTSVSWSTDRGQFALTTGTTNWSFSTNLENTGGLTKFLIVATDANGRIARKDIFIDYRPSQPVSIVGGATGVTQNANSIPMYDKFEATFSIQNTAATNMYIPYETNLPDGMPQKTGISVTSVFTGPNGQTLQIPGFYYQPYTINRSNSTVIPNGNPVWKIRFSPTQIGTWTYKIRINDQTTGNVPVEISGSNMTFNSTNAVYPNGFLKVSSTDSRYFEFTNGVPFIGLGPGPDIGRNPFTTEQSLQTMGLNGANLSRPWVSAFNISGSSWAPWTAGFGYNGNVPNTSLTTEESYTNGLFSLKLPAINSSQSKCGYYGHNDLGIIGYVKPNTNYTVFVRFKTVGITGSGGFTIRTGSEWPNDSCTNNNQTIPYQRGTTDWHTASNTFTTNSSGNLYLMYALENTTGGSVYIDEISVRETLGNGNYGPEILPRSKFNTQEYFTQISSYSIDHALDLFHQNNFYTKPVIEEKADFVFNHISPYGNGYAYGNQMQNKNGAAYKWQQYYWRYLIARYSYSTNIHSWEYVNEDAPGHLEFANEMAKYFDQNDPFRHLTTTSFWCCIQNSGVYYWQDQKYSNIDYADSHSYITANTDDTSWLRSISSSNPFTYGSVNITNYQDLSRDTALYTLAHSIDAWRKNASGNKPITMGEIGIGYNGIIAGKNDTDTKGVWLHQYLWAQTNPGSMYFVMYWYENTIRQNQLFTKEGFFKTYRRFFEGATGDSVNTRIPINNGKYVDLQPTIPAGIYGWGQKDTINGGAYLWMYDSAYTWTNPSGGSSLAGKTVSFGNMPNKNYIAQWWNTWTGEITTLNNITPVNGTVTLSVPSAFTNKDIALKLIPAEGFAGPNPQPSPLPSPKTGDINGDNIINSLDIKLILSSWLVSKVCGNFVCDLNGDNKINIFDAGVVISNWGK